MVLTVQSNPHVAAHETSYKQLRVISGDSISYNYSPIWSYEIIVWFQWGGLDFIAFHKNIVIKLGIMVTFTLTFTFTFVTFHGNCPLWIIMNLQ